MAWLIMLKVFLIALCSWLLTGCQEEPSYNFLMKHPYYTSKQALRCESLQEVANKGPFCQRVQEAALSLTAMLKDQQMYPEEFGSLILEAQMSAAKMKQQLQQAKSITVIPADEENHRKEIQKMESLLRIQQEKIEILLAVVSATRPE